MGTYIYRYFYADIVFIAQQFACLYNINTFCPYPTLKMEARYSCETLATQPMTTW
jgi:hypothetical protein